MNTENYIETLKTFKNQFIQTQRINLVFLSSITVKVPAMMIIGTALMITKILPLHINHRLRLQKNHHQPPHRTRPIVNP